MVRKKTTFSITDETLKDFFKLTDENYINRSALIESFMKKWIDEKKKNIELDKS